ncbi:MAG: alkaline phosphatase family protein [Actinobacteria bacterium]|nr:MAG: alkaline phosphatase family protein [Actinomycetota bacterium]
MSPARVHRHHLALTAEVEHWLRLIARILSVLVVAGFAVALYRYGAPGGDDYVAWEETASIITLAFASAGLTIAWFWEAPGGALAMVAGTFVGALAAYRYNLTIALGVALLFMVPAALYLIAWQRTRSRHAVATVAIASIVLLVVGGGVAYAFYDEGQGPSHPESTREPLPPSPVTWVWSGGVGTTSATVVARVDGAGEVLLAYGADLEQPSRAPSTLRGPVYRFELTGLTPGTEYRYAVEVDGEPEMERSGTFATWPDGPFNFTVAFAGCARVGSNGSVFDAITAAGPDLFIITGDFFYGDVFDNSLDTFASLFDGSLIQPAQAALYTSVPIAYTWDDHDYGPNDAGGDSPSRDAALASYRRFVPHYPFPLPGDDAPIAQAFTVGRVRFILTDTRSARDPARGTVLGAEQLDWFLGELLQASRHHAAVVWVNSIPWIGEPQPGADDWSGFPAERETIASFIAQNGISNLMMLAGDAHMVAIDDGSNNGYGGFPVVHAGALDRPGSLKGGPYSEGAFPGGGQFGLLTVDDHGGDSVQITVAGYDWEGTELTSLHLGFPAEGGAP